MNKGERNEIAQRKYKQRLKIYGLKEGSYALKSHSTPCSCSYCKSSKFRNDRKKHNWKGIHFNHGN